MGKALKKEMRFAQAKHPVHAVLERALSERCEKRIFCNAISY
jgi:hypothetical protein